MLFRTRHHENPIPIERDTCRVYEPVTSNASHCSCSASSKVAKSDGAPNVATHMHTHLVVKGGTVGIRQLV